MSTSERQVRPLVVVIGAGPAGLMAAEALADSGHRVAVHDAMPAAGRKFLVAGHGGLNLTHSEPLARFISRYGERAEFLRPFIERFTPGDLRGWADGLGADTFVGTSGRVFPKEMKAAALLKAWTDRLRSLGVALRFRSRWLGWDAAGALRFAEEGGERAVAAEACVLALGGGSWPDTGSDGSWTGALASRGVALVPFSPANCGFDVAWPEALRARIEGAPLKNIAVVCGAARALGEMVLTKDGVEGGAIYAIGAAVRAAIRAAGTATIALDLKPDLAADELERRLRRPRGDASWSTFARKALRLEGPAWALIRALGGDAARDPAGLAALVKALPIVALRPRPLAEAISSAGGIAVDEVDERLMLRRIPGCFVCGEMLDWEAPTGGYLLQACLSTGLAAGTGAAAWLRKRAGG
ncbi:MAG TPA: TIGR03862 family flavoprotein [Planctomycetota bacterium]|nr:TIGR03862 family flavoprotein [Planctomycetota bacterium]